MSEVKEKVPETIKETTSNEKEGPRLEKWYYHGNKPFPLNFPGDVISGTVYNHSRIPDGHHIVTSKVVYLNVEIGIAQTLNTTYVLIGKEMSSPEREYY